MPANFWRILVLGFAAFVTTACGGAGVAPPAVPPATVIALNPTTASPGTTVIVVGANFTANALVTVRFGETAVASAAASATGTFSTTFAVPGASAGSTSYTVNATDAGGKSATAPFTVSTAGIGIVVPVDVSPGTGVIVTGVNFTANAAVTVRFDGAAVGSATTSATGAFSTTFTVPNVAAGQYTLTIMDDAGRSTTVAFRVTTVSGNPAIALNPTSGPPGIELNVPGVNFPASALVTVRFSGTLVDSTTTSGTGMFSVAFAVPNVPPGIADVLATTSGGSVGAGFNFTVVAPATGLHPSSGSPGTGAIVTGMNFMANGSVTVHFDGAAVGSATASATGLFSMAFAVPNVPAGAHTVTATDAGGRTATAIFTVQ